MKLLHRLLDLRHPLAGLLALAGIIWILYPFTISALAITSPAKTETAAPTESTGSQPVKAATPSQSMRTASPPSTIPPRGREPPEMPYVDLNAVYAKNSNPPKATSDLDVMQRATFGKIQLGEHFFERSRVVINNHRQLQEAVAGLLKDNLNTTHLSTTSVPARVLEREPNWPTLAAWWNNTGKIVSAQFEREWPTAAQRFGTLYKKQTQRTPQEEAEAVALTIKCGRDWLKIPYDESTGLFDLDEKKLPVNSPEVAIANFKRMYKALAGAEWDAPRSRHPYRRFLGLDDLPDDRPAPAKAK